MIPTICERCGAVLTTGSWPFCGPKSDHGRSVQTTAFAAYYDHGLGQEITGLGDRHRAMRAAHFDYRDHPAKGELSARRDQIADQQRTR